jgi:hypothetical protein
MVPPRNVTLEVGDQPVWRGKYVSTFFATTMPVVAFAILVVVAQNARPVHYIRQSVLESMR